MELKLNSLKASFKQLDADFAALQAKIQHLKQQIPDRNGLYNQSSQIKERLLDSSRERMPYSNSIQESYRQFSQQPRHHGCVHKRI